MDIFGTNVGLWSYDIRETPLYPSVVLHDFTLTPLALMVVYQYCHSWKKVLGLLGSNHGDYFLCIPPHINKVRLSKVVSLELIL